MTTGAYILYNRERATLDFIRQYIKRYGYAPTLQEIADGLSINTVSTVHENIGRLVLKGYLKKTKGFERAIELIEDKIQDTEGEVALELPVLGFIAAGSPLEPHIDPNSYLSVPANLITGKKPGYVLQVKGNSMIEEGILDGDYVIIQHQQDAKNGDIVVAILPNGFATLKRIFFDKDRIKLEPANSTMLPIFTSSVKIQGKVVGLYRRFNS